MTEKHVCPNCDLTKPIHKEVGNTRTPKAARAKKRKCDKCPHEGSDVRHGPDPFAEEIYGDTKHVNLCPNCYQQSCNDI